MFLGSDIAAFIEFTKDAVELGPDSVVEITRDGYEITTFDGEPAEGRPFTIDWDLEAAEKGGYSSFMMKEINEQPAAIRDTLAEDDRVMAYSTWTGTHHGEFLGIPATGHQVSVDTWTVDRYHNGQMTESRLIMDVAGLLIQLGALPAPAVP